MIRTLAALVAYASLVLADTAGCSPAWRWSLDGDACRNRNCTFDRRGDDPLQWCSMPAPQGDTKPITRVHVVQGCHLDIGFAATAPDIVNRWFTQFFPAAHATGKELASDNSTNARLHFTAQSWLVSMYLDCPPGLGLDCPTEADIATFNESVANGWITWHAAPFVAQAEVFGNVQMLDAALELTHRLDDAYGVPQKHAVSVKDVPGWTAATIPILRRHGVDFLHVGVNGGSQPPNVPQAFQWVDPSGSQRLTTSYLSGGYGGLSLDPNLHEYVRVPASGEVMVVDWRGDNSGPPSADDLKATFASLERQFGAGVDIVPSTFETFADAINQVSTTLPVITKEIGDTWIYGPGSDPQHVARYQSAVRALAWCDGDKGCQATCAPGTPIRSNFTRFLLKQVEHTHSLDAKSTIKPLTRLHANWSNAEFWPIVQGGHPESEQYNALAESWVRQREWSVGAAMQALDQPGAAGCKGLQQRILDDWAIINDPTPGNWTGWAAVPPSAWRSPIRTGPDGGVVSLNKHGGLARLLAGGTLGGFANTTIEFATDSMSVGYATYDNQDQIDYEHDYNYAFIFYSLDDVDDQIKRGIEHYGANHSFSRMMPAAVYKRDLPADAMTEVGVQLAWAPQDQWLTEAAGAPHSAQLTYRVAWSTASGATLVSASLSVYGKPSTRLPEAGFFSFHPTGGSAVTPGSETVHFAGPGLDDIGLSKLESVVQPGSVVDGGARRLHWVSSTAAELPGKEAGSGSLTVRVSALDAPVTAVGTASTIPTPLLYTPDVRLHGWSSVLWNNWWSTNYRLWWGLPDAPSGPNEDAATWRWEIDIETD